MRERLVDGQSAQVAVVFFAEDSGSDLVALAAVAASWVGHGFTP